MELQLHPNQILSTMLTNSDSYAVIAIYDTHPEAEAAVQALQKAGFDMKQQSLRPRANPARA